jgi:carboxylesterase
MNHYMPGAEPFFFPGRLNTGCLLLHGFMSSPYEVRWLGEHLAKQGYTVHAPCLPGHGTRPEDMEHIHWGDWLSGAVQAYAMLHEHCRKVVLVGHSMGGMLSLLIAGQVGAVGVVGLAVPFKLTNTRARLANWYKFIQPYTDQTDTGPLVAYIQSEQKGRGEPILGRVRYNRWSTAAVYQIYLLTQALQNHLHKVTVPLLLLNARLDDTVPYEQGAMIAAQVSSSIVEQHVLPNSGHNLQMDIEHQTVFDLVSDFVNRLWITG